MYTYSMINVLISVIIKILHFCSSVRATSHSCKTAKIKIIAKLDKSWSIPTDGATRCVTLCSRHRAEFKAGRWVWSSGDGRRSTVDNTWRLSTYRYEITIVQRLENSSRGNYAYVGSHRDGETCPRRPISGSLPRVGTSLRMCPDFRSHQNSEDWSLIRWRIALVPTGLAVALDIS